MQTPVKEVTPKALTRTIFRDSDFHAIRKILKNIYSQIKFVVRSLPFHRIISHEHIRYIKTKLAVNPLLHEAKVQFRRST